MSGAKTQLPVLLVSMLLSMMNFVGFWSCWNEHFKTWSTQVFVFTDKPEDANAIVIAWRGTECFNANDWSTDFDFSWFKLEGIGNVHVGFMEALGLGDRGSPETFKNMEKKANDKYHHRREHHASTSGLSQEVIDDDDKKLAYDDITAIIKPLLAKNPEAKLYVTGHSLGGALGALYTGMLYFNGETAVTDKLAALYTFGQPRVGDEGFAHYMREKLPEPRYFRVVYGNDIVPRIPFDDLFFAFKHFGLCFYYNSQYKGQTLQEAPNRNFFYITDLLTVHITACGEFFHSLRQSDPDFVESWQSTVFRFIGMFLPGIGGHSPVNYVNAVRLGPSPLVAKLTQQVHEADQSLHDLEERVRNTASEWWTFVKQKFHHAHSS